MILSARQSSNGRFSLGEFGLRGQLDKYISESQNDAFSWRGSFSRPQSTDNSDWTLWSGIFGTHYLQGAPGNTESNFDQVGLDIGAEFFHQLGTAEAALGPAYQFKSYSNFDGRKDHTLSVYGEVLFSPQRWKLIPSGDFGYTNSSLSEYSKLFLTLSFRAEFQTRGPWSIEGEYLIRSTRFTSRTIAQSTAVSRGRGQVTFSTVETNESHSYREFSLAGFRQLFDQWKISCGFRALSQISKSGIEDYSSLEMFVLMTSSY